MTHGINVRDHIIMDGEDMTKEELIDAADEITGGDIGDLSSDQIMRLMTVTQHVTDLCLNEIERRGELEHHEGLPCVPYISEHFVETILTRD